MKRTIEKNQRLSHSLLWELQSKYYINKGVRAWEQSENNIPYEMSSNSYIAKYYANLIIMYIKDLHGSGKIKEGEDIFVFELGAGAGYFTYYC